MRFGHGAQGRRSPLRCTAGLLFACVAVVAGCRTAGDDPGAPVPVDAAGIYAVHCQRCHGADGRGAPELKATMPIRDFAAPEFQAARAEDIERMVMMGKGAMPPFGAQLSGPKIQALVGYAKRLGRGGAATP